MENTFVYYGNELYHHGIQGQKWGLRRWQNEDGSLTEEGRVHYGYGPKRTRLEEAKNKYRIAKTNYDGSSRHFYNNAGLHITKKGRTQNNARFDRYIGDAKKLNTAKKELKEARKDYWNSDESAKVKKAIKIGAAVAGAALVAYGGYKLYQNRALVKSFSMRGKDELGIIKNKLTNGLQTPLNSIKRTARNIKNETIPNIRTAVKGTTKKVSGAAKEFIGDESNKFKAAGNLAKNTAKSAGRSAASAAANAKASADKVLKSIKNYDLKKIFTQTSGKARSNALSAVMTKLKAAGVNISKLPNDFMTRLQNLANKGATNDEMAEAMATIVIDRWGKLS